MQPAQDAAAAALGLHLRLVKPHVAVKRHVHWLRAPCPGRCRSARGEDSRESGSQPTDRPVAEHVVYATASKFCCLKTGQNPPRHVSAVSVAI